MFLVFRDIHAHIRSSFFLLSRRKNFRSKSDWALFLRARFITVVRLCRRSSHHCHKLYLTISAVLGGAGAAVGGIRLRSFPSDNIIVCALYDDTILCLIISL